MDLGDPGPVSTTARRRSCDSGDCTDRRFSGCRCGRFQTMINFSWDPDRWESTRVTAPMSDDAAEKPSTTHRALIGDG